MRRAGILSDDEGREIRAVEFRGFRQTRGGHGRGGDVEADDGLIVDLAGGKAGGPGGQERRADTAFAQHAFLADERRVERAVPGLAKGCAVVADEDDERVLILTRRLELRAQLADAFVHGGDHRQGLTSFLGQVGGRLGEPRLRGFERDVRGVIGEVEEERLGGLGGAAVQEGQGGLGLHDHAETIVRHEVRGVGERLPRQIMRGQILAEFAAEVFVEALRVGHVLLGDTEAFLALLAADEVEVPFADLAGDVACRLEAFGDGQFGER